MHATTQHIRTQRATAQNSTAQNGTARARTGARRRALQRAGAVAALAVALAFAGQSVAQAQTATQAYQNYALQKLGGNTTQSSCLNPLWQAESGWNPNAQNPYSTAYGIPQFLDSTWASTGIAKTSNPYRQVDAGLIYIRNRYGTPCGAWSFWRAHHWY